MMDHPRSNSGVGEDNVGIPDDLRCKRSDGKQWRCTARSMPDKTVCEKHYIQAKKRAANSALRASLKKAKRKSLGESDIYLESKSDDMEYPVSVPGKKFKGKVSKNRVSYSPELPSVRGLSIRKQTKSTESLQEDAEYYEEDQRSYRSPPTSAIDSSKNRLQNCFDTSPMTETSDGSSDSSESNGGQTCHQCQRNDRERVIWCLKCDRRGYCDTCICTWYSDMPLEEIQRACPACRGSCNCRLCLRVDNLIKARVREIPSHDKLQYLYCLLASVLPIVKQIHHDQCFEVEMEKRLLGNGIDLSRTKLSADEQMCCDFCRMPIIDYHRHCMNCSYDLCLNCCQDLREASTLGAKGEVRNQIDGQNDDKETTSEQLKPSKFRRNFPEKFSDWKFSVEGNISCPPKEFGGCGCSSLTLKRIFKMNWVAKLAKNVEEMVSGCNVGDTGSPPKAGFNLRLCQTVIRENCNNNVLYQPSSQDIKSEGIGDFRKHWSRGEPVIVKEFCDISPLSSWDPMVLWRGIQETAAEKMKDDNRMVKAIDCLDWSEVDVELGQFIKGYSEGRIHEDGWPQMLKLKDWPSLSASEQFILYQRPEFISKLPLLEYIHSKWGTLNVAAKLPHYSLQTDVGPKIYISYGMYEELGHGDSVDNLHMYIRDMVYVLVHMCDVKLKGWQRTKIEKIQKAFEESEAKSQLIDPQITLNDESFPNLSLGRMNSPNECEPNLESVRDERIEDQAIATTIVEEKMVNLHDLNEASGGTCEMTDAGALWDVFQRQDVPKLIEYLTAHWNEFGKTDNVPHPLYDGIIFLDRHHKSKLREEFGVEPWSFEQHLGQAVFIPAGCPFQVRNLQSTVKLGLDFLSPESLGEAVSLAGEIRCFPNDHAAKLQMLEVGKISLYAASAAIKEVQKLVLNPKLGAELGFEDPNLTAMVSENLEKMIKRRSIACA